MYEADFDIWADWRIVREIGRGSFGRVFEIHRQNGEYVEKAALKVIRVPENPADIEQLRMDGINEEDTESYLRRYVEEIRNEIGVMQRFVGYSNIVSYEDYLIQKRKDTIGWIILIRMELLTPLQDHMSCKKLSEEEVIRIGLDISQALMICHGEGIIHRDIKPQNIFVNDRGFFKLGDFGISRTIPGNDSVLSFKGTVPYMAPETFSMQGTDERSDIYSLALVLYRILNGGREPFLSSSKFTPAEKEDAQRKRMAGETLPVPERGSSALCGCLAVALAAEPSERYQTASEFHAALQRISFEGWQGTDESVPGHVTLDLHALGQNGTVQMDQPVQQSQRSSLPQYSGPASARVQAGAEYPTGRGTGQGGIGRKNNLLKGVLCILAGILFVSLLALILPLFSKKPDKNGKNMPAQEKAEQDAAGDFRQQGDQGQVSDQQDQQAQAAQIQTDGANRTEHDPGGRSGQSIAEENGTAAKKDKTMFQNAYVDQNEKTGSGGGSVVAGDETGSVYPPMKVVEYTIYCQDEDGEILQVLSDTGIKGREKEVHAPTISGYTPTEYSDSVYLSGDDDFITFVYEKKGNIPSSAIHYNGHSYYACVSSKTDSFWDAAAYCETQGGYMAVINTEEENRTLYDYVFDLMGYKSAYFGYTDDGSDQDWYWIGSDDSNYENWKEGEPDNKVHGDRTEHYALFFHRDPRYKWNDGDFGPDSEGNVIFLIEWDW